MIKRTPFEKNCEDQVGTAIGGDDVSVAAAATLKPEFLAVFDPEGTESSRAQLKQKILSTPELRKHVISSATVSDIPEQLELALGRIISILPPATGYLASMGKAHKIARLRSRAFLYWRLLGTLPDAPCIKLLFDLP